MPRKTEEKIIDGIEVRCTELPAMRALALLPRIGKIVAPLLAGLRGGVSLESDIGDIAPALGAAFAAVTPEEFVAISQALLEGSTVVIDGKMFDLNSEAKINHAFDGKFGSLLKTLAFALKVHFGDFFANALAAQAAAGAAAKAAVSASPSPNSTTPTSSTVGQPGA